ncbi:hypothetical protein CPB84DRAFT_1774008 [Gymnopilus junonius]|uniref:HNH nuclease domain-containing protein n=1 Tax=Gymnopilus junonius TaxID=109634 RepID=A0A9P5NU15_GYMJU|nr:hypothetical protein CPB84DRAFT_1774008 [Gymnopilus junonius]
MSSFSSLMSLEVYQEPVIQDTITEIKRSTISLQELVQQAEKHIAEFALVEEHVFSFKEAKANLDKLLSSMLFYADEAGGEKSTRYVSAAVIACATVEEGKGWAERLRDLGITWLTHLLYVFKRNKSYITPHADDRSFKNDILLREGYECPVTGANDDRHPSTKDNTTGLQGVHILPRSIADFDSDPHSLSFKSAAATFDILVNFTRLPVTNLDDLKSFIDQPSNRILLQVDARYGFENLGWCLKKTDNEDEYKVKPIHTRNGLLMRHDMDALVVFRDKSNDFRQVSTSDGPRPPPIPTPDPLLISLHGAIALIMFTSGVGKFLDEILGQYCVTYESASSARWTDLEEAIATSELKEILISSFQQAHLTQPSGQ